MSVEGGGANAQVFVYTGEGGESPPQDVVRLRVDSSVTSIPEEAFLERKKLTEVELCEGLLEIGYYSFFWCDHSITNINIPNSLRRIKYWAFNSSLRTPICLHDGIESIGTGAFSNCIFTNFRVPPLITVIPENILAGCKSMFSLEVHEEITEIKSEAFCECHCLRNVAIPPNAALANRVFIRTEYKEKLNCQEGQSDELQRSYKMRHWTDLQQLFGPDCNIVQQLKYRFDKLPVHSVVYYQSYHQGVLQRLLASKLDPSGNQQDCLGMTPLHILTCSSSHDLEIYRLIVERYPTNLITEDRWGALPLLYAFWGGAPAEIMEFLLESYQALYPDYSFNWTMMVETMGRTDTPKESIENLLHVRQIHFPEQPIDWEYLLNEFVNPALEFRLSKVLFQEQMRFFFMCGMSSRVENLAFKVWRDHIRCLIHTASFPWIVDSSHVLRSIEVELAHFEDELPKLKEATTILELALWKKEINDNNSQQNTVRRQKEIKIEGASIRQQCRVTCGADVIIEHVLLFLICTRDDDESLSNESDTDDWSSNGA